MFAVEPLPIESRLWRHPRVIMSPHATPRQVDREARHYAILVENLARFQRGDALINALGPADAWQPPVAVQRSLLDRLWRRLSPRLLRLLEPPAAVDPWRADRVTGPSSRGVAAGSQQREAG